MAKSVRKSKLDGAEPATPVEALFEEDAAAKAAAEAVANAVEVVKPQKKSSKATLRMRRRTTRRSGSLRKPHAHWRS
jgi:hypothetical protein